MQFKNTTLSFGFVSIAIHWLMAGAIFYMFGLGIYMVELTYYDSWYKGSVSLHKSLGLCLLMAYVVRLAWRFINVSPKELPGPWWEHLLAKLMHIALYVFLLALFVSGYLISTADGRSIEVFSLFEVASLGSFVEQQEDVAGDIHRYLAWSLMVLVFFHALAALKHQFVDKDNGLLRMIKTKS
jgi:cytochrome b561